MWEQIRKKNLNEFYNFSLNLSNLTTKIWKVFRARVSFNLNSNPMFGSCCCFRCIVQCSLRQLLIFNILILIGRPDFIFIGATPSHLQQQQRRGLRYISTPWSIGLLVPVIPWRNLTTVYSSPYKVGLINVGTKFAPCRPVLSQIVCGKLNYTLYYCKKVRS